MKTATVFALLLAIGWSICPVQGFIPNKLLKVCGRLVNGHGQRHHCEGMMTHRQMTRNAILEVAAKVLRANTNPRDSQSSQRLSALSSLDEDSLITAYYGLNNRKKQLFKDAVEKVQKATAAVDFKRSGENKLAAAHFDSEQFESGQNRLIALRQSVVSSIQAGNYDMARRDSGRMFHTLQDFYSHTNWIENGNRAPNPVLGQLNKRIDNIASPTQQTCLDNCVRKRSEHNIFNYFDCPDNLVESLMLNGVLTSGYGSGSMDNDGIVIEKPNGKCSHGGIRILHSNQELPARGGINKDSPYAAVSPHYYLYSEAAAVAQQATIDMLRDMRRDVNDDLLFGTYLGVFENQATAETSCSQAYSSRGNRNRNAMLHRHWNRIEGNNRYFCLIILVEQLIIIGQRLASPIPILLS